MKTKIGFLLNDIAYGGAAKSVYLLIKNLNKDLFSIYIYTNRISSSDFTKKFEKECILLEKVDLPFVTAFSWGKTSFISAGLTHTFHKKKISIFLKKIESDGIQILHINTTLFSYLLPLVKRKHSIKTVIHLREVIQENHSLTNRIVIKWISEWSDSIICISNNEAAPFSKTGKTNIISNPINIAEYQSITEKVQATERNNIGMMGGFQPVKKATLFLKAIKIILKGDPDIPYNFVILGVNERRPYWKLLLKFIIYLRWYDFYFYFLMDFYKLNDKVICFSSVDNPLSFLSKLAIYVRPSGHPWGRDVIEAMASGVPVVACGTSQYYIKDGVNGFLVQPNNPLALAEGILNLIQNNILRNEFGKKAQEEIQEMCDITLHVNSIEAIYSKLLL